MRASTILSIALAAGLLPFLAGTLGTEPVPAADDQKGPARAARKDTAKHEAVALTPAAPQRRSSSPANKDVDAAVQDSTCCPASVLLMQKDGEPVVERASDELLRKYTSAADGLLALDTAGLTGDQAALPPTVLRLMEGEDDDLVRQYSFFGYELPALDTANGAPAGAHLSQTDRDAIERSDEQLLREYLSSDGQVR